MFGLIVSGRMVQTDFQSIDPTTLVVVVANADQVNHVVVFLTGQTAFPEGTGGLIYFSWPDMNGPPSWQLLGFISNDKPSAVFQISGVKKATDRCVGSGCPGCCVLNCCGAQRSWFPQFGQQPIIKDAELVISVISLNIVMGQIATLDSSKITTNPRPLFVEFAEKMLENFMNFTSSFAVTQAQMTPTPSESYVTLSVLRCWYSNFQRRLSINPYFWKS